MKMNKTGTITINLFVSKSTVAMVVNGTHPRRNHKTNTVEPRCEEVKGSYDSKPSTTANGHHLTLSCPRKELILSDILC